MKFYLWMIYMEELSLTSALFLLLGLRLATHAEEGGQAKHTTGYTFVHQFLKLWMGAGMRPLRLMNASQL